jgi:hypothetical protein
MAHVALKADYAWRPYYGKIPLMTEIVKAKPQFQALSEETVLSALADTDPENPIAVEVARLIDGYTRNFQRRVERLGYMPSEVLRAKGACPIEEVAMHLTSEAIRGAVAQAR